MISLLFDIDGTLMNAGGAGMKAVNETLVSMFGDVPEAEHTVHGRTDHGIMTDVFEVIGRDYQNHREEFDSMYWGKLPSVMRQCQGRLLPGVLELLAELERHPDIAVGILTGNAQAAAMIKLERFEIQHCFAFGGYGDHHSNRNDVAAEAVERAKNHLGSGFNADQVWVIGDTVNDITCARSVGAKVIAVETGGGSRGELIAASPDHLMVDLSSVNEFVTTIRKK